MDKSPSVISLKKINFIGKINKRQDVIKLGAGVMLFDLTMHLKKYGYFIFNVPGGKNVSLGGAISGNVHGRFSSRKFANFGDNVISLKILDEKGRVRILNKKNKLFYRVIGGQSNFGIIIEATLKLKKIKFYNFDEKKNIH